MGACVCNIDNRLQRQNNQIPHTTQQQKYQIRKQIQKNLQLPKAKQESILPLNNQSSDIKNEIQQKQFRIDTQRLIQQQKMKQKVDTKTQLNKILKNKKKVGFFNELQDKKTIKQISQKSKQSNQRIMFHSQNIKQINNFNNKEEINKTKNQQYIQDFQSRILFIDDNMINKAVTQQDNKLILLTTNSKKSIQLHGIKFINGSLYKGSWMEGKRHGFGKIQWQNGGYYQGDWINNYSQGKGKIQYPDGSFYIGNFVQNMRQGQGIYAKNQVIYQGQWYKNVRHGKGIQKYGNLQRYQGFWKNGHKHGYGELFFEDGSYYKGQFCQNQLHGKGTYKWQGIKRYTGQWHNNLMSGKGILLWNNGVNYEGQFQNSKMNGFGKLLNEDCSTSQGCFIDGKKNGHFIETSKDGKVKNVEYNMGKKVKTQTQKDNNKKNSQKKVLKNGKYMQESKTISSQSYY